MPVDYGEMTHREGVIGAAPDRERGGAAPEGRGVLAPVAIRPEFLAILGDECQYYAADGDGSQDRETERFRHFAYEELAKRDKLNLDIFWLRDESLEAGDNLPAPDVLAASIAEDLRAALAQFAAITDDLEIEEGMLLVDD